jgi:predicted permease
VYTGIQLVDGSFQPVVGVRPVLGRFISDEDDRAGAPVIVISETFWVRHLGGIADAIGRTVTVNEKPFTVIGVTPSSYRGLYAFGEFTAAIPLSAGRLAGLPDFRAENRPGLVVVGRLDRNVSASAVQEAVRDRLLACCVRDGSPTADAYQVIEISRGIAGKADVRAQFATLMYSLMAGVLVLLLVACANVGTLLVARAEGRRSELAVRYSLGAERARLVRQLLTESLQLAVVGALFGYLCARAGLAAIASQLPPSAGTLSEVMTLRPHPVILGFTVVVTIACSALFGILPAWRATRVDIVGHLKDGGQRSGGRRADGVDRFLITAQVALALLLVTTAGMLVQSLTNLRRVDGGFNATNLLLVVLDARGTGYERSGILHLQGPLLERIRGLPGVRAAAASSAAPVFGGNTWITPVTTPYIDPGADESHAFVNPVSAGFFSTSGIALRRGREFTPADRSGTTPVAIVSETFIRRFFPEGDGLGNVVYLGDAALRVVGVAADARFSDLREAERPVLYLPILQQPSVDRFVLSVRTVRQPNVSAGVIRGQIEAMAPGLSILRIASMDDAIRDALVRERLAALLATLFGAFALGLATLGIYGVVACSVASRTAEIGTRMALGARRSAVLWLVLRQSVLILAFGFLAGLPLSLLSARAIASQLYGVRAFDPLSLATALLALGAAGVLASLLPARHATRVDPLTALRSS